MTSRHDAKTKPVEFGGVNEVQVFKTSVVGLGNYSRSTGYPAGDVTATWETIKLEQERGRAFAIDRMDNEETLGMAFGTLSGEFIRTQVVPEVDAYRFAKWAGTVGISTTAAAALPCSRNTAAIMWPRRSLHKSSGRLLYPQPQYRPIASVIVSKTEVLRSPVA